MAAFTTDIASARHRTLRPRLRDRFDALFTKIAVARTCAREVGHLSGQSDAQLAARGLRRESLVRHGPRAYL